jgi:subtilase family serine protease
MARSFLTGAAFGVALLTAPQLASAAQSGLVGTPAATLPVSFNIHLPLRNEAELDQLIQVQSDPRSPLFGHFLTVAQFRANYGPTPQAMAQAAALLRAHGLTVVGRTSQTLRVSAPAASVQSALHTTLGIVRQGSTLRVENRSAVSIPADLAALGATVTGLAHNYRHVHAQRAMPLNRNAPNGLYWFDDLKQAYSYPSDQTFDGKNAVVGIVMSSDVLDSDTALYFDHEHYSTISGKTPLPLIRVPINGGAPFDLQNNPGSAEAGIDVQTSQGSAPGAQIELFNIATLSDQDIIAAYLTIIEGITANGTPILQPDIVSNSFGDCELFNTAPYNNGTDLTGIYRAYHELFKQANAEGITFVASSGDNSGLGCTTPAYLQRQPGQFIPGVEQPADDPNVTAVGGTNLLTSAPPSPQPTPPSTRGLRSKYVSESEYGDPLMPYDPYGLGANVSNGLWGSGSGTSVIFKKPWYQNLVHTPSATYRTVPDISMQMGGCPLGITISCNTNLDSASVYFLGGGEYRLIGTSLSAPEFAGLLAVKVGATGKRLGNANGYIYAVAAADGALPSGFPSRYYHQGIPGFNGIVTTTGGRRGYSPIVGVGTPYTQNFLGLPSLPVAGDPQTISNP